MPRKQRKPARERVTPTLKQREQEREAERLKLRPAPPPRLGKMLPFRDPNAPKKLESKDTIFIIYRNKLRKFPWKKIAFTMILILIGGIGSAVTQARIANTRNYIIQAERDLWYYRAGNITLSSRLDERYTLYEIERRALELGMSFPDPSQIIEIYVPRVGGVTLNTADYALPRHNYFREEIRNFLSGIINQIFGGNE
ncbi:MAG: hypothetical protein FWF79_08500 [Defluviitaleaceae bacterium]|nr:hypothetical protein [Defluviitaleaceae bacterium]